MSRDVDVMRRLLLELEKEQRSPPEPVFIPLDKFSRQLDKSTFEIAEALDLLLSLDFIEGPGAYQDAWLFRKLTRRGAQLLDAIRDMRDWAKVKNVYGALLRP